MLKRWRRRWFVLQDSTLYSFKKERVYDEATEVIDLRVFSSVKSSEDYTHRAHSFDVYSTDMVFSMVAPSESDKEGQPACTRDTGQADELATREQLLTRRARRLTAAAAVFECYLYAEIGSAPSVAP